MTAKLAAPSGSVQSAFFQRSSFSAFQLLLPSPRHMMRRIRAKHLGRIT
jgi:hypothetical protein